MRVLMIVAMAVVAMFGCATGPMDKQYKADTPANQPRLEAAQAKCKYEVTMGVKAPQGNYRTSVGAELDMIGQRNDLFKLCMKAEGWGI